MRHKVRTKQPKPKKRRRQREEDEDEEDDFVVDDPGFRSVRYREVYSDEEDESSDMEVRNFDQLEHEDMISRIHAEAEDRR